MLLNIAAVEYIQNANIFSICVKGKFKIPWSGGVNQIFVLYIVVAVEYILNVKHFYWLC